MYAFLKSGKSIQPDDEVLVKVHPYRTWGRGRPHLDLAAEPILVKATVLSVSFEKDAESGSIIWNGTAATAIPVFDKETGKQVGEPRGTIVTINQNNCEYPDGLYAKDIQALGKSAFVPWDTVNNMVFNLWGLNTFGDHVVASAVVLDDYPPEDVFITLTGLKDSDFDVFRKLFDADTDGTFDPQDEFNTGEKTSVLPYCVSMSILNKVFSTFCGLKMVGTAVATSTGIFFMEGEVDTSADV